MTRRSRAGTPTRRSQLAQSSRPGWINSVLVGPDPGLGAVTLLEIAAGKCEKSIENASSDRAATSQRHTNAIWASAAAGH